MLMYGNNTHFMTVYFYLLIDTFLHISHNIKSGTVILGFLVLFAHCIIHCNHSRDDIIGIAESQVNYDRWHMGCETLLFQYYNTIIMSDCSVSKYYIYRLMCRNSVTCKNTQHANL